MIEALSKVVKAAKAEIAKQGGERRTTFFVYPLLTTAILSDCHIELDATGRGSLNPSVGEQQGIACAEEVGEDLGCVRAAQDTQWVSTSVHLFFIVNNTLRPCKLSS